MNLANECDDPTIFLSLHQYFLPKFLYPPPFHPFLRSSFFVDSGDGPRWYRRIYYWALWSAANDIETRVNRTAGKLSTLRLPHRGEYLFFLLSFFYLFFILFIYIFIYSFIFFLFLQFCVFYSMMRYDFYGKIFLARVIINKLISNSLKGFFRRAGKGEDSSVFDSLNSVFKKNYFSL